MKGVQKKIYILIAFICVFHIIPNNTVFASEEDHATKEEFNAGLMILDHVVDHYGWHILDYKGHPVVINLPVILYSDGQWDFFSSARFEHGHASYKGYAIAKSGPHKNKIVKVLPNTMEEDFNADLPIDLSVTKNVAALFFSLILLMWMFISIANRYKKHTFEAPKGMQSFWEPIILFIRDDIAIPSLGKKKAMKYLPYLLTLFFFIFINNILGLVPIFPGGANLTGNVAVTMVLALFTFVITTASANKNYWVHIINAPGVPWWLKFPIPLMPVVEIVGIFTKPFVLMVRLFANIAAGHFVLLGFISLIFIFGNLNVGLGYGISIVSVAFGVFISLLELLVAFIQAYVFTLLSALYFGMATEESH